MCGKSGEKERKSSKPTPAKAIDLVTQADGSTRGIKPRDGLVAVEKR